MRTMWCPLNGDALCLEQKLESKLFHFSCRQHSREIDLRAAFEFKFGPTSRTIVPLLQRFKNQWPKVREEPFETGMDDNQVKVQLKDFSENIAKFCNNQLQENIDRQDYAELIKLSLIFIGGYGQNNSIAKPGAMHHSRWIPKIHTEQ